MSSASVYRPDIDGLRSVAVVPVVLYHAGVAWMPGGFVGVDVFFVISGFLITSILLSELDSGKLSIAKFYERRVRRILPALFVVMAATLGMGWLWMSPGQFLDLSGATLSVILFSSNVLFWRQTDYFAPASEENPLLHTWSLSVEEQFYLFFPLLLAAAWRLKKEAVFWLIAAATIASLCLSEWASRQMPVANFYLLPFRSWELGAGVLCAFLCRYREVTPSNILAFLGLAAIVSSILLFDESTRFPSLYAAVPVIGTCLLLVYGGAATATGRLLSMPLLVGIGLVSYSAYLWHQPLFAIARIRDAVGHPPPLVLSALVAATFVLAFLTWKFVEQPFRKGGRFSLLPRRALFVGAMLASVPFLAIGLGGLQTAGFRDIWLARHPQSNQTLAVIEEAFAARRHRVSKGECSFYAEDLTADVTAKLVACSSSKPVVVVFGDSHSIDLFNGVMLNDVFPGRWVIGVRCRIHEDPACATRMLELLQEHPDAIDRLIYTQAGFHLLQTSAGRAGRDHLAGIPLGSRIDSSDFVVVEKSVSAVDVALDAMSKFVDVIWLGPRLEPHISQAAILRTGCAGRFALRTGQRELFLKLDQNIEQVARKSGYRFVSQQSPSTFNEAQDFVNCDVWFWRDGDHWSLHGARLFVSRLASAGAFQ